MWKPRNRSATRLTNQQALETASASLRRAGIERPRFEAELLLEFARETPRASILAHPEQALGAEEWARFEQLVSHRARREPLAYVRGAQEFFGRRFSVSPAVLIPRPETELLVEHALAALDGVARDRGERPRVVDVGTGSGAIALTVGLERSAAVVMATDVAGEALQLAGHNRDALGVANVRLVQADLLCAFRSPFDLVLANLPYIPEGRWEHLQPEVRYEPREALLGGEDGLAVIARLLRQLPSVLTPGGAALLEIDEEHGQDAKRLAAELFEVRQVAVLRDHAGLDRILRIG